MKTFAVLLAAIAFIASQGCRQCDRSGCAAMDERAPRQGVSQGIAGTIASQSDVVSEFMGQTCNECPLSEGWVSIWRTEEVIATPQAAQEFCASRMADANVYADPHYAVALEPGNYLVCHLATMGMCGSAVVSIDKVTTVNIRAPFGYPVIYVSQPGLRPSQIEVELPADCPGTPQHLDATEDAAERSVYADASELRDPAPADRMETVPECPEETWERRGPCAEGYSCNYPPVTCCDRQFVTMFCWCEDSFITCMSSDPAECLPGNCPPPPCGVGLPCPEGYTCEPIQWGGEPYDTCVPVS